MTATDLFCSVGLFLLFLRRRPFCLSLFPILRCHPRFPLLFQRRPLLQTLPKTASCGGVWVSDLSRQLQRGNGALQERILSAVFVGDTAVIGNVFALFRGEGLLPPAVEPRVIEREEKRQSETEEETNHFSSVFCCKG